MNVILELRAEGRRVRNITPQGVVVIGDEIVGRIAGMRRITQTKVEVTFSFFKPIDNLHMYTVSYSYVHIGEHRYTLKCRLSKSLRRRLVRKVCITPLNSL